MEIAITIFIVGLYIYFRTRQPKDERTILFRYLIRRGCTECDGELMLDASIKEIMIVSCSDCGERYTINPGLRYAIRGIIK